MKKAMFKNVSKPSWRKLSVVAKRPLLHIMIPSRADVTEVYENFDLWLGVRGRCTVEMLDQTIEMCAGSLILVPPHVPVRKFTGPNEELEMWFCHFDCYVSGQVIEDATPYVNASELSLTLPDLPDIALFADVDSETLSEEMHSLRNRPQNDFCELMASIMVMTAIGRLRATYLGLTDSKAEERLERATQFMGHNFMRPILLDEIARHVDVSRETLTRLFSRHYDVSPMQYLTRLRMARASELFKYGEHNVSQVSKLCGYTSLQYFSRAFSKAFGMSPTAYRKNHVNME